MPPELYRDGGRGQAVPGYAVVRNERELALNRGRNTVRFTDVAALIDPTTVAFESLTDPKGTTRLVVFAGRGPDKQMQQSISLDDGKTWSPMKSNGRG